MDFLDALSGNRSARRFDVQDTPVEKQAIPKDKQVVKRIIRLSGTTHSGYDFTSLAKYTPVKLILDPNGTRTKPHDDKTAVAVFDEAGKHIAYLPRAQAQHIYPLLESNTLTANSCVYEVNGGGDFNWGVQIYVTFIES